MTFDPLSADGLVARAAEARSLAYAPYSDFPMGAAVATSDGAVYSGVLVENVSLGLAMCAERVAMFTAVAAGSSDLVALALVSRRTGDDLTMPCGACCQVALELGGPSMTVVAADPDGEVEVVTVGELVPRAPRSQA